MISPLQYDESKRWLKVGDVHSLGSMIILFISWRPSYFGSLAIGTPPTAYNVILDTGSAYVFVS